MISEFVRGCSDIVGWVVANGDLIGAVLALVVVVWVGIAYRRGTNWPEL